MNELRSALVFAVPEAANAVDVWRERTCAAKPSNGVPAHVTLFFPFVPAAAIDDGLVAELHELFASVRSFGFELGELRRFPDVLYLAPEPPEPFAAITDAIVAAYPGFPPYGGGFDTVSPHLTAAEGDREVLRAAQADIERSLPIRATAREILLLEEVEPDLARWRACTRFPLVGSSRSP